MRFRRRTRLEKAVKQARDVNLSPPKGVKSGVTAVVAATAASAAISAVRRRSEAAHR